jgi:hypothetical protein
LINKVWELEYQGHKIKVIDKFSLFTLKTSEYLEIDGKIVAKNKGSNMRTISTLVHKIDINGKETFIEARIALKTYGSSTGCHILINGDLVGGDKKSKIQFTDHETSKRILEKGFARFFLTTGLLRFGLPFAILITLVIRGETITEIVWRFTFNALLFGVFIAYIQWRGLKAKHRKNPKP